MGKRIGVVSDTHSKAMPAKMLEDFKSADLIIHVGDFCDGTICKQLAEIAPLEAVYGNMDDSEICGKFSEKNIFEFEGVRFGIIHGAGISSHVPEWVESIFKQEKVDVVVFGHSHHPYNEKKGGVLYFNPGSPSDKIFAPYRSYGILTISDGKVEGEIIKVDE